MSADLEIIPSMEERLVLQPNCNRVTTLERRKSLKKITPKTPPPPPPPPPPRAAAMPASPKLKSPRPPAVKRGNENHNGLDSSSDKIIIPKTKLTRSISSLERKKSKKWGEISHNNVNVNVLSTEVVLRYSPPLSALITEAPGSIAAVRSEQVSLQSAQRKMKIAHYGRSKSAKFHPKIVPLIDSRNNNTAESPVIEKRCSYITPNSDSLYVAYHDEEWGVPVHDDNMLFELLILSGAQVGSDWTSILKKRQNFRDAFSGFDAEIVAKLSEKKMISISVQYAIDMSRVRGVVDNANRIIEIKKEFGSLDKYIWGFVNDKPISPQYKFGHKIPVKTSKSESISKDMLRRGFRNVGPTTVHSFMQAAGLTNDHLITCYRHLQCTALASPPPPSP